MYISVSVHMYLEKKHRIKEYSSPCFLACSEPELCSALAIYPIQAPSPQLALLAALCLITPLTLQ